MADADAANAGVKAVLERLAGGKATFDRTLGYRVDSYGGGKARLLLEVTDAVANPHASLHGGAIATLVDQAGTIAIMTADRSGRPGVTTDLNVTYLAPAPVGTTVIADGVVLKIGKTLAFVSVDIRRQHDDALVAQGRMTKFQGG